MAERKIMTDDLRDQLPDDLNAVDNIAAYDFPDNSRRRIPGALYVGFAVVCVAVWFLGDGENSALLNRGILFAALLLSVMAIITITSGWRMTVDEKQALVVATRAVGYPVGHASAQQVWRGIRSRPTWRIFCYSVEEPPLQRGLVLIDAVSGEVIETLLETNPDSQVPASAGEEN
jgi:hypothetical protein